MIKAGRIAAAPLWAVQLFTGAKSFRANGLIGSRTLNRMGLHVGRKLAAHGLTAARRAALAPLIPAELRRAFLRDGYVVVRDFLPAAEFEALRAEAVALADAAPRRIQEGDTRTELSLVDDEALAQAPHLKRFIKGRRFLGLCNYVGARLKHPFCQVQVLEVELSTHDLRFTPQKGQRIPLHSFGGGKALLARLSPPELDAYFREAQRTRFTEHTLADEPALRREIALCRARGYAVSVEEHSVGVNSVAVAVDDAHSISIAMPSPRFSDDIERHTIAALKDAAEGLESPLP